MSDANEAQIEVPPAPVTIRQRIREMREGDTFATNTTRRSLAAAASFIRSEFPDRVFQTADDSVGARIWRRKVRVVK
jgi:hypothetical protein